MTAAPSEAIQIAFDDQAVHCEGLGSPFTAGLCRQFAKRLNRDTAIGRLCDEWPGSISHRADAVPLRLCGGLHFLALKNMDAELSKHYPPNLSAVPGWDVVEAVLHRHEDFLLEWMKSPPQTNEVQRSNMIWPALMLLASRHNKPLNLMEVGASAGLNLQMDRFAYTFAGAESGTAGSPLHLEPDWQGQAAPNAQVNIATRSGCDLMPIDPTNQDQAERLRAYIWPDQADRHQRLNAAFQISASHPVPVENCDAVAWLRGKLAKLPQDTLSVVYSTVAWQYLPEERKQAGEDLLRAAGAAATENAPFAWLRFEADGQSPGGQIRLISWPSGEPGGKDEELGRADFHGRWVRWKG